MAHSNEIIRVTLPAKLSYLSQLLDFVRATIKQEGFSKEDVERLTLAIEEASLNVIQHAYEDEENESYTLIISRRHDGLILAVEDQGIPLPYQPGQAAANERIGMKLLRSFADEVSFHNLGQRGKRIDVFKRFPFPDLHSFIDKASGETAAKALPLEPQSAVTVRLLQPVLSDAVLLARCIYRAHGYSYATDSLYYPERVLALHQSGAAVACVVEFNGEIIGHVAAIKEKPDDKVAEACQAFVDPRYRGGGLFVKMVEFLRHEMFKRGIYGFFCEAVTIHPATQKVVLAMGVSETGILLSYIPDSLSYRKIAGGEEQRQRQTVILSYLPLNPGPERIAYLPQRHRSLIDSIYKSLKLVRHYEEPANTLPCGRAEVTLTIRLGWGQAFIRIHQYGANTLTEAGRYLERAIGQNFACIYLDCPLALEHTPRFVEESESLGFFLAGIIPEGHKDGDILRLQFLNHVELNPDEIVLVSEKAKEMMSIILSERKRLSYQ
ncbi:MAG: GNAT family N-acetyltransferase [Smithella sp.]